MDNPHALVFYRKNYLAGIARPGALLFDGTKLTLCDNDLNPVWSAPLDVVQVKKGMGILTVSLKGEKASILTAIGSGTSPSPSDRLTAFLESGTNIDGAPSVDEAWRASSFGRVGIATYAVGQKALREYFIALGVLK